MMFGSVGSSLGRNILSQKYSCFFLRVGVSSRYSQFV
jgi:hypothetical protein